MQKTDKQHGSRSTIQVASMGFVIGALLVFLLIQFIDHKHSYSDVGFFEDRYTDEFPLISPLLECTTNESKELSSFDNEINAVADRLMSNGTITDISYYFRDLNNGLWVGINEDKKFAPASLMKMPLMISYLKESETNTSVLDEEYIFTKEDDNYLKQNIAPEEIMELGKSYTVADLIVRMIEYSDNSALRMLLKNGGDFQYRVFDDLSIDLPTSGESEEFMSVLDYSRFFRILYNASYLNQENSNYALDVLSQAQYKDGLIAGVPGNVLVSHKFGERIVEGTKQLHDCGIVYESNNPYIICIMTRGSDLEKLSQSIAELSKVTYEEVTKDK